MEDTLRQNRTTTAPSDPFEAELARLEEVMQSGNFEDESEPELEEDDTTDTEALDTPDEDDLEDDDTPDEVNTPEDDEEEIVEESPDSKATKKTAPKPKKQEEQLGDDEDDESPRLSRKQRGKLIEELRQELEEKENQRKQLEQDLAKQREADAALDAEVSRALGTQEDYEKAENDALNGDARAQQKVKIWKDNRKFYGKLVTKAKKDVENEFVAFYWQHVQDLPGVKRETLSQSTLSDILRHMYDAGKSSVGDEFKQELEDTKQELLTLKGRYRKLKVQAGGAKRSPTGPGGDTSVPNGEFDWRTHYTDPRTGLLTAEADRIVDMYGFAALQDPKYAKKKVR